MLWRRGPGIRSLVGHSRASDAPHGSRARAMARLRRGASWTPRRKIDGRHDPNWIDRLVSALSWSVAWSVFTPRIPEARTRPHIENKGNYHALHHCSRLACPVDSGFSQLV